MKIYIIFIHRDYLRIVESHTLVSNKLDEISYENNQLKQSCKENELKMKDMTNELNMYKQQSNDLSSQLQHLLKKYYDLQYGTKIEF